jgi:thiol-disulfide isomerase/thioredoxin
MRQTEGGTVVKSKKALIIFPVLFLLSVIAIQCTRPASETGQDMVGRNAPEFNLPDLAGHEVSLEQYKGKIVILDFWATWCQPCRMIMPMLDEIQEDYSGKLSILAINLQEPKDMVRDYTLRQNLHSRVLLDADYSIGDRYGVIGIPMQVLIDQNGIIRYVNEQGIIPGMDSRIRDEINKLL